MVLTFFRFITFLARKARVRADSGVYHVVIQSASHGEFFRDEEDYEQFVLTLDMKTQTENEEGESVPSCKVYAYCLLPTHVHLLIKEGVEDISMIMKRIGSSYVHYFNRKYGIDGTLFKGRFKSEPVDDEARINEVARFVYENPRKHGIMEPWRYRCMVHGEWCTMDGEWCMMDGEWCMVKGEWLEMTEGREPKPSDVQVWKIIMEKVGARNRMEFLGLTDRKRREVLTDLRNHGASVRQLERLTGVGRGIIQGLMVHG